MTLGTGYPRRPDPRSTRLLLEDALERLKRREIDYCRNQILAAIAQLKVMEELR